MISKKAMIKIKARLIWFWQGSIVRKLVLGFSLLFTLFMVLFVHDLVSRQRAFLLQQSQQHAMELAKTLSSVSARWVITADLASLDELLQSQQNHIDLDYAMILDRDGIILAHTDPQLDGSQLRPWPAVETQELNHTSIKNQQTFAMAPIIANRSLIGWTRVALNQEALIGNLAEVTRNGIFYTLFAILASALIAYSLARGLTRGLSQLIDLSESVRSGAHQSRISTTRKDELGKLSRNFNLMLDTLAARNNILDEARERLVINQRRLELALEGGNYGLWDWDILNDTVYYSDRWQEMLGYSEGDIKPNLDEWMQRIHPEDRSIAEQQFMEHLQGSLPYYESTQRLLHREGTYRWFNIKGIVERDKSGKAIRYTGTTSDITAIKFAAQQSFEEGERFKTTLNAIADAVIATDIEGHIKFINPAAEIILGVKQDESSGTSLLKLITLNNELNNEPLQNPIEACLQRNETILANNNIALTNHLGERLYIEATASPIKDINGTLTGAVMIIHDVSLTHELSRHMAWQATHDSLTGLVNRREFERQLNRAIVDSGQSGHIHALLYLDLDQFKLVNDTCGHTAGDVLLKQLTYLLKEELNEGDILARLGGDEFGILLYNQDLQHCIDIADRLRTIVRDYHFAWDNMAFDIGVSIGIVQITADSGNLTRILSAADMACYAAKDSGRNRYHIYQSSDKELMRKHGEMQWASRLTEALNENRFILYCQSIEPIAPDNNNMHMEILVRMVDKDGQHIPPGAFIPAAERYNFMISLDRWVCEHTLQALSQHAQQYAPINYTVSINLSGQTLGDSHFQDFILEKLEQYQIQPEQICFEITETAAIQNLNSAALFIKKMKTVGCLFSLDDFGSGLSSFNYLKNLPVDFLKIDGSFVKDILDDPIDRSMVKAINEIGHTLALQTIAEFVDNPAVLELLREIGVDYAQGFTLERPLPLLDKLQTLLE